MKAKYSKEDLIHSLPDYVSDNIEDNELVKEIERVINSDNEVKNEFIEISNTMNFLNSAELEHPGENYFNNLSVKINERIHENANRGSIHDRLGLLWKILIPALSILLISFLFLSNRNTDNTELATAVETKQLSAADNKENEIKVPVQKINEAELNTHTEKTTASERKQIHRGNKKERFTDQIFTEGNGIDNTLSKFKIISDTEEDETFSAIMAEGTDVSYNYDEEAEEDILFINDDEDNFEEELMEFTPEEQKEILENITKSQI